MWKEGDIIVIQFCDIPDNQEILNRHVRVVEDSQSHSPHWTEVEWCGKYYTVRGAEARKV